MNSRLESNKEEEGYVTKGRGTPVEANCCTPRERQALGAAKIFFFITQSLELSDTKVYEP